jgi:hypothetical protein
MKAVDPAGFDRPAFEIIGFVSFLPAPFTLVTRFNSFHPDPVSDLDFGNVLSHFNHVARVFPSFPRSGVGTST